MSTAVFILPLVCAPLYKVLGIPGSGLDNFCLILSFFVCLGFWSFCLVFVFVCFHLFLVFFKFCFGFFLIFFPAKPDIKGIVIYCLEFMI